MLLKIPEKGLVYNVFVPVHKEKCKSGSHASDIQGQLIFEKFQNMQIEYSP